MAWATMSIASMFVQKANEFKCIFNFFQWCQTCIFISKYFWGNSIDFALEYKNCFLSVFLG